MQNRSNAYYYESIVFLCIGMSEKRPLWNLGPVSQPKYIKWRSYTALSKLLEGGENRKFTSTFRYKIIVWLIVAWAFLTRNRWVSVRFPSKWDFKSRSCGWVIYKDHVIKPDGSKKDSTVSVIHTIYDLSTNQQQFG